MKKDYYIDFNKNFQEIQKVQNDTFFSDKTIQMVPPFSQNECVDYFRQQSPEEVKVITKKAFDLLVFWVRLGEIEIEFFERFMSIAVSFRERISLRIDEEILPALIEMISMVGSKDYSIHTALEIYTETPEVLTKRFTTIH